MILITGGTGFLGLHTARLLLAQGYAVRLVGRDFSLAHDVIAAGAVPLRVDLRDPRAVVAACAGVEAVIHAGALSAPWGKRSEFFAVNVGGTAAVLAGCRRQGVRRLIHVSSPAVHFSGKDHINLAEDAPYPRRYNNHYALTKKLSEDRVKDAIGKGLDAVILRPKAIFGPGDRALLPRIVRAAQAGRLPQIGNGANRVDLTYVENVAEALLLALETPAAAGRTYTITNGEHVLLWDVLRTLLRRLGISDQLKRLPLPLALGLAGAMEATATLTGREPLLTRYSAALLALTQTYDISAARRDLGYQPRISVAEGIERTLRERGAR